EALLKAVERSPDTEAVVFLQDGVRKTFAQLQQDVSVNPAYQPQEVEFALRKVGCKAIVCLTQFKTQKYCDMLRQICPEIETSTPGDIRSARLPDLRSVIVIDSRQPGMFHLEDVMQAGSSQYIQQLQDLQKKISFDDPINIQFTSGTTGVPKGATLSHHNIINNAYFVGSRMGYTWRPDLRICLPVPMYHCFGSVGGGMCIAMHSVNLSISPHRCTYIYGTPTMYVDWINQPDLAKYDLSSVHSGIMAGSPCPPEVVKKVITMMGVKEITIGYGTTENSPVTFCGSPSDNLDRKCDTVGYIMDHIEAKIVNPSTGEIVPLGMLGEVMIRGYCVMLEYWGDEAKTRECITKEGWYKTGDIGSMDAHSYLRIEGRIKDMIIRGGENIYPAEIEQFLHTHPKIKEAQVVGVADPRMGEEVCACIKLVDGKDCTEEEIKAYCKGQIAHFKIPRYVLFVTSYPLTITGKVRAHIFL
uniref:Medium-chain acyl-CoA ligase ACSF2, mitochondrial n=1 Tax=Sander lucioperca TaxID=283035 RepID=A0A8D0CSB7_SANLU